MWTGNEGLYLRVVFKSFILRIDSYQMVYHLNNKAPAQLIKVKQEK